MLATRRSRVRSPAFALFLGKLFSHVCLYHQFGTGQAAVMPCGWEGNRRPCVTDTLAGIVYVAVHKFCVHVERAQICVCIYYLNRKPAYGGA